MRAHLEAILLRPAFFQWHHEVGHEAHLGEFPLTVLANVFVVVASCDQEGFAVIDRFRFQIREALSMVAGQFNRMVMDELLDPRNSGTVFLTFGRLALERSEKASDFFVTDCLAEMREVENTVSRE
jgi:hypothetical protein